MGKKLSVDEITNLGRTIYSGARDAVRGVGEEIARQMLSRLQEEARRKEEEERGKFYRKDVTKGKFRGETEVGVSGEGKVVVRCKLRREVDGTYYREEVYSPDPGTAYNAEITGYTRPSAAEKKVMTVQKTCSTNKFQMVSTEMKLESTNEIFIPSGITGGGGGPEETKEEMYRRLLNSLDRVSIARAGVQSFVNKIRSGLGLG